MNRTVPSEFYARIHPNLLDLATDNVNSFLVKDETSSTLVNLIGLNSQAQTLASGLTDNDYPDTPGLSTQFANVNQLRVTNKVALPTEIRRHFNHVKCFCMMGLFTEINRAWVTIDKDIYVWTYEHGSDVAYFDGLNETISCVGLVKPRDGVFQSRIKYLLILATTLEIVVLGVTFTAKQIGASTVADDEMHLISEPIFILPTDGVSVTTICGTSDGRVLLGGIDGSLIEIKYQAERGWFGKRASKVNHSQRLLSYFVPSFINAIITQEESALQITVDNSRHIAYMLTDKCSIEVFDMGVDGQTMAYVTKLTHTQIVKDACKIIKTIDASHFQLVNISALETRDSPLLHLVAITSKGVRLFFTTISCVQTEPVYVPWLDRRPKFLELVHVRLPPGFSPNAPNIRPKSIKLDAAHAHNTTVMVDASDQNYLWCLSSDPFANLNTFRECYTIVPLDATSTSLARVKFLTPVLSAEIPRNKYAQNGDPALAVVQHYEPPVKYVVLTTQGALIFTKLRPVDLLKQLLLDGKGPTNDGVKGFFHYLQTPDEACATCLILACADSPELSELAQWACEAFFLYGDDSKLVNPLRNPRVSDVAFQTFNQTASEFNPALVSTPIQPQRRTMTESFQMGQTIRNNTNQSLSPIGLNQTGEFSPTFPGMNVNVGNQAMNHVTNQAVNQATSQLTNQAMNQFFQPNMSPKHNGLYLYLCRILRPIWYLHCTKKITVDADEYITSTINADDCAWVLCYVQSLKKFLDKNTLIARVDETARRVGGGQDAQLEERQSLESLKYFVGYACEVLGLWRVLCEHQFHAIARGLTLEQGNLLLQLQFKDVFVAARMSLLSSLIGQLINVYLNDNASVDSISAKLRVVCPTLYRMEDATCSKANEMLLASKTKQNQYEREEMLMETLNLCKNIAPHLNLPSICQKFLTNQFYVGVLELSALCAKKIDDKDIGLRYYDAGQPIDDQDGCFYFGKRMECYKEITNMLDYLHDQNHMTNMNETNVETSSTIKSIMEMALRCDDKLLHIAIYEWLLTRQMHAQLISIKQASLEQFLIRVSQQSRNTTKAYDLLWQFYEKNGQHPAAAKILNQLAVTPGNSLTLQQRIEYLARSIVCMRSDKIGYVAPLGVFLRELEDRIEIANVQKKILLAIETTRSADPAAEHAVRQLNSKLFDITELYEQFAEPFNLWECKLAIIYCSGYYDDAVLIHNIWENIINTIQSDRAYITHAHDKIQQLLNHIAGIAREYGDSEYCFPLTFIVNLLEIQACKLCVNADIVPKALISMQIPFGKLIDAYKSLLKERIAGSVGNEFHMFEAVAHLVNAFCDNPNIVGKIERYTITTKAEDLLANALSSLYSKPNTSDLIQTLRNIKTKLSRC